MRNSPQVLFALILVAFVSCVCPIPASAESMPGGWARIAPDAPEIVSCLSFLKADFPAITVDKVREAYQQVVAGMNFKLVCDVSHLGHDEVWEMVIYRDLNGAFHLTHARRQTR